MMKRALTIALLVALTILCGPGRDLWACGDKFLMLGLGTRYERSPAARQAAAILLYASPGSDLTQALAALSVEATLKKEGYRPTVIGSAAELDAALQARKWDVVVVDAAQSSSVSQRVQSAGAPHVVPMLTRPSKDELKEARRTFRTVLNSPTKSRVFVDTIEDAMDLHDAEVRAAARKTR